MPQTAQRLFESPRPSDLEFLPPQCSNLIAPSIRHVLPAVEPQVRTALERLVARRHQRTVLLFAHRVHRVAHIPHDMDAVEDNLFVRIGHLRPCRLDVGLPHVYGHRLLVDTDPTHDRARFALPAPRDRPFHQSPRFLPADPQDPRRTAHIALTQHVDGPALEQQRGPRPRLRPRHQDLDDAMFAAGHAGNSRMQVRLELATVQMPPGPFLGVVIERQRLRAVRTRPRRVPRMLVPHLHALPVDVQVHAAHSPWRLQG